MGRSLRFARSHGARSGCEAGVEAPLHRPMVEGRADHLSARPEADVTRFSVVESVRHLIAEYRSFIKSSYRLAHPEKPCLGCAVRVCARGYGLCERTQAEEHP